MLIAELTMPRNTKHSLKLTLMEKLLIIRMRNRWTSDEAGKRWGVLGSTLRDYESGRRNPSEGVRLHLEKIVEEYESHHAPCPIVQRTIHRN